MLHALVLNAAYVHTRQALDLSCNALGGSEGATLLAQTLALCSRLQFLNLDGNNLRAAGAGAMAEGMRGAVALREGEIPPPKRKPTPSPHNLLVLAFDFAVHLPTHPRCDARG